MDVYLGQRARSVPTLIAALIATALFLPAANAELYFAPALISSDPDMVADLQRFEKEGAQLPGSYRVDVYINNVLSASRDIVFVDKSGINEESAVLADAIRDETGLMACLTMEELESSGVNVSLFPDMREVKPGGCISPGHYITGAFTRFDFQQMRLDISVPQVAMKSVARGYISPARWDEGINAAMLNYSISGSNSSNNGQSGKTLYAYLNGGVNLGPWRARDYWTMNDYSGPLGHTRQWQHVQSQVSRAVIPLRSELVVGDSTTPGDVFDPLGFRGVQMGSDINMYPDSLRGYAPVIKGVARTNARVDIRQNGYSVYQAFVPPGAFAINDLYSVTTSGDLEVTVTEADGAVSKFVVPYSAVPVLQREGNVQYSLTAGTYRPSGNNYNRPQFVQGAFIWGLPYNTTAYAGMQYARNYRSALLGGGLNLGLLGAVSVDVTHADSTLPDGSRQEGQSARFLYARSLNALGTTFQLTGYRYSTQGFHTLDETALKRMSGWLRDPQERDADGKLIQLTSADYFNLYNNKRSKFQATVTQRLGDLGSVYLSGVHQTYWGLSGASSSLQTGFSSSVGSVSYSLSYGYSKNAGRGGADRTAFLNISVPLSAFMSPAGASSSGTLYANYSAARDTNGALTHSAGLSGTALEDNRLSWNVSQQYARDAGNNGSLFAGYQGTYGAGNAGYSYSPTNRQINYGVSGGAVLHRNGLTFGQQLGETGVLVAAPGVSGTEVENETGVRTDWRGYAIKPYATAYRENRVGLNPASLAEDVELEDMVRTVVPTRGAIVRASYKGNKGARVLMKLMMNQKPLPFGAIVRVGDRGSIVGDDGQVYLSGMQQEGVLQAKWGEEKDQSCTARWRLPEEKSAPSVYRLVTQCRGQ
ncbi:MULTISPECIES: fimbrial biogenesis usher protein [Rahnella]|uniref:Fimbrial biogenesis usher protein n=1 Tax=Rahnella laticis TaxID=2787622 RepID=A0ABS0E264_9GAMM|nr:MULTISPECIES: fimbrial biogenesis usher protein [Rahnella]MBF7979192.1 fimbrial biogenesis usher protein [Rahnella laticis]MBF7999543.1 fimbrial biogenesis usher protein [Rahnella sp. LAC-M12]